MLFGPTPDPHLTAPDRPITNYSMMTFISAWYFDKGLT